MILKQLMEAQKSGALGIKIDDNNENIASIGGLIIGAEQAATIAANIGWEQYVLSPFKIIEKTNKFAKSLNNYLRNETFANNAIVTFKNFRSSVYGKTHDRIHIAYTYPMTGTKEISIIYNMATNTSSYQIYDYFTSNCIKKCRNMKQVCEYLNTL